jgi:predicted GNAT family acetyltransferase
MPRRKTVAAARALSVRALTAQDWPIIESLFGPNGACGGCWCMLWRLPQGGAYYAARKGAPNRRAFRALVRAGRVYGALAFDGEQPVGWCAVGPKQDFPYFARSRVLNMPSPDATWSVTCFFVKSRWRGRGVAGPLLAGAVAVARARGAAVVEGYPVVPAGSGQIPGPWAWTGVPRIFARAGFKPIKRAAGLRPIYRLKLTPRRVGRKSNPAGGRGGGVLIHTRRGRGSGV